jgi:hypothetical protein
MVPTLLTIGLTHLWGRIPEPTLKLPSVAEIYNVTVKSAKNLIIIHSHHCRVSQIHRQVTEYNNVSCYGDHLQRFITCHMRNIYRWLSHNLEILQGHVKW